MAMGIPFTFSFALSSSRFDPLSVEPVLIFIGRIYFQLVYIQFILVIIGMRPAQVFIGAMKY